MSIETEEQQTVTLYTHQEITVRAWKLYDLIICLGGVGSGKTLTTLLWMLDRGEWDAGQPHVLFAPTQPQLSTILQNIQDCASDRFGLEHGEDFLFHKQPPPEWRAEWEAKGIKPPPRPLRYANWIIWRETGLHVSLRVLHNKAFKGMRGGQIGSALIEEFSEAQSAQAIEFVQERLRCSKSYCKERHRHVLQVNSNPPDDDAHWIYDWLGNLERRAAAAAGENAIKADLEDAYPNLMRGTGTAIYIPSSSYDNTAMPGYAERIEAGLDEETALRNVHGVVRRRKSGRVYYGWQNDNEWERPVYDPLRTLYMFRDFNAEPSVALFAHPLKKGEYPAEHEIPGVMPLGIFGEYFNLTNQNEDQTAIDLIMGSAGSNGYLPSPWKGLGAHKGPIIIIGDPAEDARKSVRHTGWKLLRHELEKAKIRYTVKMPRMGTPTRINSKSVNAAFRNHLVWVAGWCTHLIIDLETNKMNPEGSDILKPGGPRAGSKFWQQTHCGDALRYGVHEIFPWGEQAEKKDPTAGLPKTGTGTFKSRFPRINKPI